MSTKRSIAVMVLLETDDARLFPENLDVSTVSSTAAIRLSVIRNLKHLRRVVMICDEELAQMMCAAHAEAARAAGVDDSPLFPPPAYVPPTQD